jgi:hypothetical protein
LSDMLRNNREKTKGIIKSAEEVMVSFYIYELFVSTVWSFFDLLELWLILLPCISVEPTTKAPAQQLSKSMAN